MDFSNKNQKNIKRIKTLEQAAEMWSHLCLFYAEQKKSKYQNNNKKNTYAYSKK